MKLSLLNMTTVRWLHRYLSVNQLKDSTSQNDLTDPTLSDSILYTSSEIGSNERESPLLCLDILSKNLLLSFGTEFKREKEDQILQALSRESLLASFRES